MKTAVIVVHGVCPHPRYEIQDEFTAGLQSTLNAQNYLGKQWKTAILWPTISRDECGPEDLHASALRIYAAGDDPSSPNNQAFDIFEGYWSPIDKNQTNVTSVLSWLVQSLFQPLNGYARLWASASKTLFDLGYLAIALALVALGITLAFIFASRSWQQYAALVCMQSGCTVPGIFDLISHPFTAVSGLGPRALVILITTLVGAYSAWTLIFSVVMDIQRALRPKRSSGAKTFWRHYLQIVLAAVAGASYWLVSFVLPIKWNPVEFATFPALWLVASVGALKSALALIRYFLINFLGDVQIYCTHDENARFFQFRDKMVRTVEAVILAVLRSPADRPPSTTVLQFKSLLESGERPTLLYDRVFVAGHSLGATIAMDALLNVHELVEEQGVDTEAWRRLRGLVTFGAALEKTRFFFDVRNPSLSASVTQWRNDVSGHLFTADPAVLRVANTGSQNVGIFWANFWYFPDIVANEIGSFQSTIPPGADLDDSNRRQLRDVCKNAHLRSKFLRPLPHVWIHGDYLTDASFWESGSDKKGRPYLGVADILETQEVPR